MSAGIANVASRALRQRGFTLLEILVATALLATAMALAFATVRSATAVVTRGELMAERNARIRAVHGFLRQRIGAAQGIAWGLDNTTGLITRFEGEPARMRFVADLPAWLGRGGPHLHTLAVAGSGPGTRLQADFAMVQAGQVIAAGAIPPEPLAAPLASARFGYRGLDANGAIGPWQSNWQHPEALPLQVRVDIADEAGPWPELVVELPLAASYASVPGVGQ